MTTLTSPSGGSGGTTAPSRDWTKFVLDNFIWVINIAVFIFFAVQADGFLTGTNTINLLLHASVLGLMVIGQAICLISGNFDLSAEGTVSLLSMLAAWMMVPAAAWSGGGGWELHPLLVIPLILAIGTAIGWFNGTLITRLGMNNFIVTLAMQLVLRGLALSLNQGQNISGTPELFNWLGSGRIGPIPVQIIVTAIAFIGFHLYLNNSRFGRQIYAVGGNREAARASGFSPKLTITAAYMISGFLAAMAAWMLLGRLAEATDRTGANLTLETVAASVIGGISLRGGYGTILGAFSGVLLLSIVGNGLNLMNVDPFWVNGIRGFIILVAIFIEAQKFRYKPRSRRQKAPAAT